MFHSWSIAGAAGAQAGGAPAGTPGKATLIPTTLPAPQPAQPASAPTSQAPQPQTTSGLDVTSLAARLATEVQKLTLIHHELSTVDAAHEAALVAEAIRSRTMIGSLSTQLRVGEDEARVAGLWEVVSPLLGTADALLAQTEGPVLIGDRASAPPRTGE